MQPDRLAVCVAASPVACVLHDCQIEEVVPEMETEGQIAAPLLWGAALCLYWKSVSDCCGCVSVQPFPLDGRLVVGVGLIRLVEVST